MLQSVKEVSIVPSLLESYRNADLKVVSQSFYLESEKKLDQSYIKFGNTLTGGDYADQIKVTKSLRSINSVEGSPLINRVDNYNSDLRIELSGKL
jgi:hypothetical protein